MAADITLEQALAAGYCITSRAGQLASRIDREDWREHMAASHVAGMSWVEGLGPQSAADHYRRCFSRDSISVPSTWIKRMPNSNVGPGKFKPRKETT